MAFTQISFVFLFFPITTLLYLAAHRYSGDSRMSNVVLLCSSMLFVWWGSPRALGVLATLIIFTHFMSIKVSNAHVGASRKIWMTVTSGVLLLVLFIYKYLPLFSPEPNPETGVVPVLKQLTVPVGLSFFILAALSYLIDVYRRAAEPGSIFDTFLFMTLFPKMICGPALRWKEIRPQLVERKISIEQIDEGISRIIIGLAKKAIIADTLYAQVLLIDSKIEAVGADVPTMWLRGLLLFFTLYCDFSGYSDIAIGLFRILGFSVEENFDYPYLAPSLADFWRRWHMSLNRWMKDYIYIPLGGSRKGNVYINLFITFLIASAWYGGRPGILIWGAVNGLFVVIERTVSSKALNEKIPGWIRRVLTMLIIYMGWVLFTAPDLPSAGMYFKGMFVPLADSPVNFEWKFYMTRRITLLLIIAAAGSFGGFRKIRELMQNKMSDTAYDIASRILLIVLFALDIMFIVSVNYVPFFFSKL